MRFFLVLLSIPCFGADRIAQLPASFEARQGEYFSHGNGYSLTLTRDASRLSFGAQHISLRLIGTSGTAVLEGLDPMPGRANYFRGSELRESFDLYSRVRRRDVYPGTDMVFRGNQDELEYDFVLAPGRDPGRVALAFDGADRIHIDPHGDLILNAGAAEIREPRPEAYQVIAGLKRPVRVVYTLDASNQVRFRVGRWNPKYGLVIDPQIVFSNSFGGSASSHGEAIALDAQGNIYVAGQTNSADFPVQNAAQGRPGTAAVVASADGGQTWTLPPVGVAWVHWMAAAPGQPSVLYAVSEGPVLKSTDGGNSWTKPANNGLTRIPAAIAVDAGSPTTLYAASPYQGVYVSTDGAQSWTLMTSGLIPSNSNSAADLRDIMADPNKPGAVFAVSDAPSAIFRSTDFGQTWTVIDIQVVTRINNYPIALVLDPSDSNTWYLGEQNGAFLKSSDGGNSWTVASTGINIPYPQGLAISSSNSPLLYAVTREGLKRSSDGGQTWAATLPLDYGSVATDPRNPNTVYALDQSGLYRSADAGQTWTKMNVPDISQPSSLFVSPADSRVFIGGNSQTDVFVTKWSRDGSQILYSTYLGGSGNEDSTGLAVDTAGNAYVTGYTTSHDFPLSANAFQQALTGPQNAFVSKLSPDGSHLVYSTLLPAITSGRIAVDANASAIVTGTTAFGLQRSLECNTDPGINFPTSGDAFVMKLAADGGSLLYSAQINGSCWSEGQGLAVDASGNLWVSGQTTSPDLPVTPDALQTKFGGGHYDGFLARLDTFGSVEYLSYLGGSGFDTATGITFDRTGNIYLTGSSAGLPLPASAGAFQPQASAYCLSGNIGGGSSYVPAGNAFVLKLDPAAHTVLGLTYLGAPFCLSAGSIAVDASGSPWIAGGLSLNGSAPQTASPFRIGIGSSFISKFSKDLTQLLFSTYFDPVGGLVLDSAGVAYVSGSGPSNPVLNKQQAYVMKIDSTPPEVSLDSVPPAAISPYLGLPSIPALAPGEVVRVLGKKMGPAAATPGVINSGILATSVAGVQVTFDGMAAPLLSVSDQEIDLVTPFELAGKTATTVQVQYNGVKSNPVQIAVTPMAKEILALLNEDFTPNSASNPARAGSMMIMYVSGLGQTSPPSQDGQINSAPLAGASMPIQLASFEIDPGRGVTLLPITFAGAAPGLAAGILQINFVAPQQSLTGVHLLSGDESLYGPPSLDIAVQ